MAPYSDALGALAAEIDTVIRSPYPVSLKPLHEAIKGVSQEQLFEWVDLNLGHVGPLAQALVEALELWPSTLDIVDALATVPTFRDELLSRAPRLLNDLLDQAVSTTDDFERLSDVCSSLLSSRLPAGVGLPASAQLFFSKLFDSAVREPRIERIKPVYAILEGACSSLFDLLPKTDLIELETRLKRLMRSQDRPEEPLSTMYSILIISKIPSDFQSSSRANMDTSPGHLSSPSGLSSRSLQCNRHPLLCDDSGLRIMGYLATQAVYACGLGARSGNPAKLLRTARLVLCQVDPAAARKWMEENPLHTQKLFAKLSQMDLPTSTQVEALAFAAALPSALPAPGEVFKKVYLQWQKISSLSEREFVAFEYTMPIVAPSVDYDTWRGMLNPILREAMSGSNSRRPKYLNRLMRIVSGLIQSCGLLRGAVLETTSCNDMANQLANFIQAPRPSQQSEVNLQADFVGLVLAAGLYADNGDPSIPAPLVAQLLSKQQRLCQVPQSELLTTTQKTDLRMAPNNADSPGGTLHDRPWRERVKEELNLQSRRTQQTVMELFGKAVVNLERRCESIEIPLRAEEARSAALKAECDDLRARISIMENDAAKAQHEVEKLRTENVSLTGQLATASTTISKLEDDATSGLRDANQLRELNEQLTTKVHERDGELHAHMELVSELEMQLKQSSEETAEHIESIEKNHRSSTMEMQTRIAVQAESIDEMEVKLANVEVKLCESRQEVERHEQLEEHAARETTAMSNANAELKSRVEHLTGDLSDARAKVQGLERDMANLRQNNHVQLEEVRAERDETLRAKTVEAQEAKQELEASLREARQEAEHARLRHDEVIAEKDLKMEGLKRKSQQLEEQCQQKAAELNKTRAGLLKTLGLSDASQEPSDVTKQQVLAESQVSIADLTPALEPAESTQVIEWPATTPPKRQKQHQPFRVPSRRSARAGMAPSSAGPRRQASSKSVLADMSPNRRVAVATPVPGKRDSVAPASTRSARASRGETSEQENGQAKSIADVREVEAWDFDDSTCEF